MESSLIDFLVMDFWGIDATGGSLGWFFGWWVVVVIPFYRFYHFTIPMKVSPASMKGKKLLFCFKLFLRLFAFCVISRS